MTTTLHSPTAGRRRLRHALRQARDAAGLTQEQVAEAMEWSLSKVIRIETGAVSVSTSDLRQIRQIYGVVDHQPQLPQVAGGDADRAGLDPKDPGQRPSHERKNTHMNSIYVL